MGASIGLSMNQMLMHSMCGFVREGVDSDEVSDGVIVDYDEDGNVLGIKILEFSKRKIDLNELVIRGFKVPVEA